MFGRNDFGDNHGTHIPIPTNRLTMTVCSPFPQSITPEIPQSPGPCLPCTSSRLLHLDPQEINVLRSSQSFRAVMQSAARFEQTRDK
jgi:hypothetical protein